MTFFYVAPFYVTSTTRPSPSLSRDAPSVIRGRIRAVTLSCIISTFAVLLLILEKTNVSFSEALRLLGWWPVDLSDVAQTLLLTAILFTGPLFERGIAEGEWREWARGSRISETLGGWIGWRNYIAVSGRGLITLQLGSQKQGPITEEVIFRSVIVPLHLLAKVSPSHIVFVAPLYFGVAHVHHFYEFRISHSDVSLIAALLRSVFQFTYTTMFGWYATFVYLRTGSLLAVILAHAFCNWCGVPRLWGRVEAGVPVGVPFAKVKEDEDNPGVDAAPGHLGIWWTFAYYALLFAGAIGFYYGLWPLTQSSRALASFTANSK